MSKHLPGWLIELEEDTGYRRFVSAPVDEVVFPAGYRGRLAEADVALRRATVSGALLQRRVWRFHAWVLENLGEYAQAALLQKKLGNVREADLLARKECIARELTAYIPARHRVGSLLPIDASKGVWAALTFPTMIRELYSATPLLEGPSQLLIAQKEILGWRKRGGATFHDDANNVHLTLQAGDILVVEDRLGGSWQPTNVTGFRWQGGQLRKTLSAFSHHGVAIQRIRRQWTLRTFRCIGPTLSHVYQPRWPTVYEKVGQSWHRADARYPAFFRKVHAELREKRRRYPGDEELPRYLEWTTRLLRGERVGPPPKEK